MNDATYILIVEDIQSDRVLAEQEIRRILKNCVFRQATNQEEFLDALETFHPDIILSDYSFSQFDGMTALRLAKEHLPLTPVIIWTDSQNEEIAVECMRAGANNYVLKDNIKKLGLAIVQALEERRLTPGRRQTEEAHRKSNRGYEAKLLHTIAGAAYRCRNNRDWTVEYISNGCLALTGYAPEQFVESKVVSLASLIHPDDIDSVWLEYQANFATNKTFSNEYRIFHRNGEVRWVWNQAQGRYSDSGELMYIEGLLTDITKRKLAELALFEQMEQTNQLLSSMLDAFVLTDMDGRILNVNPAYCELMGFSRDELLSMNIRDFDQSSREVLEELNAAMLRDGRVCFHTTHLNNQGNILELEINITVFKIENQELAAAFIRDITEKKQAAKALEDSLSLLEKSQEIAHVGCWKWSVVSNKVYWSDELCRIHGIAPGEFDGSFDSFAAFLHPDDRDSVLRDIGSMLETKTPHDFQYRIVRPDGNLRIVRGLGKFTFDGSGNITEMIGAQIDVTEREQSEYALREAESQYRNLVESVQAIVWEGNPQTMEFFFVSKEAETLLGYPVELWLTVPSFWSDHVHPDDREWATSYCQRAVADLMNHEFEYRMIAKDGREVWLRDIVSLSVENGVATKFFGVMVDITERKRAENLVRLSEERFRQIAETITGVFWLMDVENDKIMYLSPSYETIWGRSSLDLLQSSQDWRKSIHPDDSQRVLESMDKQAEGAYDEEYRIVRPDDEIRWIHDRAFPIRDSRGNVYRIAGMAEDVTKEKHAEEALRRSEEQFRLIAENVTDMITVRDFEGKWVYCSPSYLRILGKEDVLPGQDSFARIHPDDQERIKSSFKDIIDTESGRSVEFRVIGRDSLVHFIESRWSVIRDARGAAKNILSVSRDVTEKRRIDEQILRSQRLESIGTLAGGIAHDLNNILTPILLAVSILERRTSDRQSLETIKMIESVTKRGADLIKQVLVFARGVESSRAPVSIPKIIEEIEKVIRETFPKSISLRIRAPWSLPTVLADSTQVHQVLMNLCVNARDSMPNGGVLEIVAETVVVDNQYSQMQIMATPGLYIAIGITDQGSGIHPAVLERIFEPFFTTKEIGIGTGLGLSTVLAIVKSHGGFVNAYSDVGKGTTVKAYFPIDGSDNPNLLEQIESVSGSGELILVVDDEEIIREITRSTLESNGYDVLTAADGVEAISIYVENREKIALVITDMSMPIMEGPALIRALQRLNPSVKVIGVSGLKQNGSNGAGAAFLHKPYTSEKLLATIAEVLRH